MSDHHIPPQNWPHGGDTVGGFDDPRCDPVPPRRTPVDLATKTFKREVGALMLAFLIGLCVYDLLIGGGTGAYDWAQIFVGPFTLYIATAFGSDAVVKQWPRGGRRPFN